MHKKALVVAVGAALAMTSAMAQKGGGGSKGDGPEPDSIVVIYGKVYPEILWVTSKGATASGTPTCTICGTAAGTNAIIQREEMESSNSRLGFRGYEKLGANLKAIFQLETAFSVTDTGTAFAARDSFVGFEHSTWGVVKLGRMDTPFKEYGDDLSFLGVSSGNFTSTSGVYRHIGFGTQNNAARFHERRNNVTQYESPRLGGFDFKVQYSTNEAKVDSPTSRNPRVWSMGGKYAIGGFEIMAGYEIHYDLFGLSNNVPAAMRNNGAASGVNSEDKATALAVKWRLGAHTFEIDGNVKKYDEPNSVVGRARSYENNAYMFIYEGRFLDPWRFAFHYVKATAGKCSVVGRDCNTDGLEGEQMSLGAAYNFSRRTWLFLMGSKVKNGKSAVYNNSNLQAPNVGEDISQVALGIHTVF